MTNTKATSLALLLSLFCAACTSDDGELPGDEGIAGEENADSKGDRDELSVTALDADVEFAPGAEIRKVITSADGYEAYFGSAAPSDVDWSKEWVAFYSAGGKPTGGYSAAITRVTVSESGKTLKLVTSLSSPGDDCFTTQATTNPYTLVRFPKPASEPSRARFYRDDKTVSCTVPTLVEIGDADDGKTFAVIVGQDIVVHLSANPTTGYRWRVTSTNRTFGYPVSDLFQVGGSAVGAGGTQTLTWKTTGPLNLVGTHTVELAYARTAEETPDKTFSFTVEIAE